MLVLDLKYKVKLDSIVLGTKVDNAMWNFEKKFSASCGPRVWSKIGALMMLCMLESRKYELQSNIELYLRGGKFDNVMRRRKWERYFIVTSQSLSLVCAVRW